MLSVSRAAAPMARHGTRSSATPASATVEMLRATCVQLHPSIHAEDSCAGMPAGWRGGRGEVAVRGLLGRREKAGGRRRVRRGEARGQCSLPRSSSTTTTGEVSFRWIFMTDGAALRVHGEAVRRVAAPARQAAAPTSRSAACLKPRHAHPPPTQPLPAQALLHSPALVNIGMR